MRFEPDKKTDNPLWQPELALKLALLLIAFGMIFHLGHVPGL
jgi:hypothetical protein